MNITVAGAGAFGTALAIALSRGGRHVTLVARNTNDLLERRESPRLPGFKLPDAIEISDAIPDGDLLLFAVPMQSLTDFVAQHRPNPRASIACCKGVDLTSLQGPSSILEDRLDCPVGVLTGPSFAVDLAAGLPTALTLATKDISGPKLQDALSNDTMRLYLSDDPIGAELGGALKNVIAIACGICMGAGLGESARAALMTRGMAEVSRMAIALGAQPETLAGLSGFGDLALTCSSAKSRNYSLGLALGGKGAAPTATTEGKHTARAILGLADRYSIDMPIAATVAGMVEGTLTLDAALATLMSRPLRKE